MREVRGDQLLVCFDDRDLSSVAAADVRPLSVSSGTRLYGSWDGSGDFYPGTVKEVREGGLHIVYDDGDEEWTTFAMIRLPSGKSRAASRALGLLRGVASCTLVVGVFYGFFSLVHPFTESRLPNWLTAAVFLVSAVLVSAMVLRRPVGLIRSGLEGLAGVLGLMGLAFGITWVKELVRPAPALLAVEWFEDKNGPQVQMLLETENPPGSYVLISDGAFHRRSQIPRVGAPTGPDVWAGYTETMQVPAGQNLVIRALIGGKEFYRQPLSVQHGKTQKITLPDPPRDANLLALQGKWMVISQEADGKPLDAAQLVPWLEFKGDRLLIQRSDGHRAALARELADVSQGDRPARGWLGPAGGRRHLSHRGRHLDALYRRAQ